MQKAWDKEMERSRADTNYKPSLYKVLIKVFGTELMIYGLILAVMELLFRYNTCKTIEYLLLLRISRTFPSQYHSSINALQIATTIFFGYVIKIL